MKHTKGEWTTGLFPHLNHPHRVVMTKSGQEICTIHSDTEEVRANVKLISASPNMLNRLCKTNEVLRWAIDEGLINGKQFQSILNDNLEVINKATEL